MGVIRQLNIQHSGTQEVILALSYFLVSAGLYVDQTNVVPIHVE